MTTIESFGAASGLLLVLSTAVLAAPRDDAAAAGAVSTAPPRVEVETLDGGRTSGQLVRLDGQDLTLDDAMPIPLDRVLRVSFSEPRASAGQPGGGEVRLVDGSRLAVDRVRIEGDAATITLPASLAAHAEGPLRIATATLRAARLGNGDDHAAEWDRLVEMPAESDRLVVYRDKGRSIRAAPCSVELVTPDAVRVRLDGEPIDVPVERVYGVLFATTDRLSSDRGEATLEGGFGELVAQTVHGSGDGWLEAASALGFRVRLPLASVSAIDYSAGRLRWLSRLRLIRHRWEPAFGFPAALAAEARPPGLVNDRAFDGGPLRVVDAEAYPRPGSEQRFERGVALRSPGEAEYALPPGFPRFQAVAGIDPRTALEGSVLLRVFADERLVFEHVVDGSGPVPIDADLGDAATLRLVVDAGDNLDLGDNLHLGGARVTTTGAVE